MHQNEEFLKEVERLNYTKQYMEMILHQSKAEIDAAEDKIREAMTNIDYLDSSDSFMNILTNSRFYELARTQKEGLEAVRNKPYFARIHFQRKNEPEEFLYIGKTSLFERETHEPIIIDWRSPVASVYYDGRLGDITYTVREEEHSGHLFAKRQYKIEGGELFSYRDVDLTTTDELLQEVLASKADSRLTEIIATIQKEQNEIIRAHLKKPILVQGAAGSGKTTIALHRISYFLYTMGKHFEPEKLMILAPSKLFLNYISDVLPELGVSRIKQTTYEQYVMQATNIKLKVVFPADMLEQLDQTSEEELYFIQQKASSFYKEVLDRFIDHHIANIDALFTDVFIEKYRIMKASRLRKLFNVEFAYMPIEKRLERIEKIIQTEVKRKAKIVLQTVQQKYDEAIERALNGMRDEEKRKRVVTKFLDERDERLPIIRQEAKACAKLYMKKFTKANIKKMYRELVTDVDMLNKFIPEWDYSTVQRFAQSHQKEVWTQDDCAAILYLHAKIKDVKPEHKMQVVFIDEVQDYSLMQIIALKEALQTDMFTMVGDLAQGIHSYRSVQNWQEVTELFPRITYTTLQKSYRTTIEIMSFANKVLKQVDSTLPKVDPVVRHGESPAFIPCENYNAQLIANHYKKLAEKFSSIALITKTTKDASTIASELEQYIDVQMLEASEDIARKNALTIVPSHLAKGLEFDAVIAVAEEHTYHANENDKKLLYVVMTRAMHSLTLIGPHPSAFFLTTEDFSK